MDANDIKEKFLILKKRIKQEKNYVPRNHQTLGGMWTVDTWKDGDLTYQLMDEGYTDSIRHPKFLVIWTSNNTVDFKGDKEAFMSFN